MALTQRINKFAYFFNWTEEQGRVPEVHFYSEYGMFAGRVWTLFVHKNGVNEECLNGILSTPYHAKLEGLHIYLTLSYYSGSEELLTRYDLQKVANSMLEYYFENYVKFNRYLLNKCAERK